MNDDGYVVSEAIRLNEALDEITGLFRQTLIRDQDRKSCTYARYQASVISARRWGGMPDEDRWLTEQYLDRQAEKLMGEALTSGHLQVWTADRSGERARDHAVLFQNRLYDMGTTLKLGQYRPLIPWDNPPDYVFARLWVKTENWRVVRSNLLITRGSGRDNPLPVEAPFIEKTPDILLKEDLSAAQFFEQLKEFIASINKAEGKLPSLVNGEGSVVKRALVHFAPRKIKGSEVKEAAAELGLSRSRGRPKSDG